MTSTPPPLASEGIDQCCHAEEQHRERIAVYCKISNCGNQQNRSSDNLVLRCELSQLFPIEEDQATGDETDCIVDDVRSSSIEVVATQPIEHQCCKKKPMSELAAPLKIYPQVLENVRVTDKKAAQNDPAVQEAVSKVAEALGDTGRILVRESGTEPVVRVMVEAPDHNTCQKYVDEVVNVICEKGYKA